MDKKMHTVTKLMLVISILTVLLLSCEKKEKIVEVPYDCPPSAPTGVFAYNDDGFVSFCWFPNPEDDIEGYDVYYGEQEYGDYYYLGTVYAVYPDPYEYCFNDTTDWGQQWFYAVAAFDKAGNESDLSYETVSGTPRPEGVITLYDYVDLPDQSGFDLYPITDETQRFNLPETDFYFSGGGGTYEIIAMRAGVDIQDIGYVEDFYLENFAPSEGWSPTRRVEAIYGHCYMLRLDHEAHGYHYAKIYVTEVTANFVTIRWAYQTDPGNPDLMPAPGGIDDGGRLLRHSAGRGGEKIKVKKGFSVGRQFPPSFGEGNTECK